MFPDTVRTLNLWLPWRPVHLTDCLHKLTVYDEGRAESERRLAFSSELVHVTQCLCGFPLVTLVSAHSHISVIGGFKLPSWMLNQQLLLHQVSLLSC